MLYTYSQIIVVYTTKIKSYKFNYAVTSYKFYSLFTIIEVYVFTMGVGCFKAIVRNTWCDDNDPFWIGMHIFWGCGYNIWG